MRNANAQRRMADMSKAQCYSQVLQVYGIVDISYPIDRC